MANVSDADNKAYTGLGCISLPCNLTILAVIFSEKGLLKKSASITGLTLANIFVGFHLLSTGVYKLVMQSAIQEPATFNYCLFTLVPLWYPLAFSCEALFLLLSGIEKLVAIKAPHWFRLKWNDRNSWRITGALICLVFLILIFGLVMPADRPQATKSCLFSTMYGLKYVWFLNSFVAICGTVSAMCTVTALIEGIRHIRKLPLASGRMRRQIQLTKSMVTISIVDVALVVIPNILSLLSNLGSINFPWWIRPQNSSYTHGINATVAFFAFFAFSRQFRKATTKLFKAQKAVEILKKCFHIKSTNVIQPIQAN